MDEILYLINPTESSVFTPDIVIRFFCFVMAFTLFGTICKLLFDKLWR